MWNTEVVIVGIVGACWSIPQDPNTSVVTKARTYRTTWDWHQHPPLPWILSYFSSSGSRADLGGATMCHVRRSHWVCPSSLRGSWFILFICQDVRGENRWNFMRNIWRPAMPGSIKTTADIVRSFRGPYWNSLCMGLFEMPWWLLEVFQKSLWTAILGTFRICWIYRCQRRLLRVCVCAPACVLCVWDWFIKKTCDHLFNQPWNWRGGKWSE